MGRFARAARWRFGFPRRGRRALNARQTTFGISLASSGSGGKRRGRGEKYGISQATEMGMRRLLGYMLRYRRRFLAGMACLLATATLAMSVPLALKCAVDELAFAVGDGAEAGADASGPCFPGLPALPIESYALLIVGIALVQAVVRSCSRFLIFNVARDVEYDLRNDLFAHCLLYTSPSPRD